MLDSMEIRIEHCQKKGGKIDMYEAAELVRRENLADNMAFEDIVLHLAHRAAGRCDVEFLASSLEAVNLSTERQVPLPKLRPDGEAS